MKAKYYIVFILLSLSTVLASCYCKRKTNELTDDKTTVVSENDKLYPISANGLEGYIDASGKIVIKPQFEYAGGFSEELAFVNTTDNKRYLIDVKGNTTPLPDQIDLVWMFHEGFARIAIGNKYGYIDKTGRILSEPIFDLVEPFYDNMACVTIDGMKGFIDNTGKMVINPQYAFLAVGDFSEGLAPVRINGKWGFIDKTGKIVIEPQYNDAKRFNDGLALVSTGSYPNTKYGFIDNTGSYVINPQSDYDTYSFSDGLAAIRTGDRKNQKFGFIDKIGNITIEPQFDEVRAFTEGIALVKIGDEWGYIDKTGKVVITPRHYDMAFDFIGELAPVIIDHQFHYINKKGDIVWTGDRPQFILSLLDGSGI